MVKPDVSDDVKFARLRRFNLIMGFLHLVQGILMIVLSSGFSLPVYANYLGLDEASRQLVPQPEILFTLSSPCRRMSSRVVRSMVALPGPPRTWEYRTHD